MSTITAGLLLLLREMGFDLGWIFIILACYMPYCFIFANTEIEGPSENGKKNLLGYLLGFSWIFTAIGVYYSFQSPQDTLLKEYVEYTRETSMYFMDYIVIFIILLEFVATIGILRGYKLSRNIYTGIFFFYVLYSYFFVDDIVSSGSADAYFTLSVFCSSIAIYLMHTDWDKCFLDKS